MGDILQLALVLAVPVIVVAGGWWLVRGYLSGQSPRSALFGPRPERRLGVVEHVSVDGRRRLVLIRRDDVEHLIMTGGPVDVVIETGIGERRPAPVANAGGGLGTGEPPVFGRQRGYGTADAADRGGS